MYYIEPLGVKDEVLSGEPLYVIKDSNGNIVYDNVKLELKTPLIQQGTEVNKALFDKVDSSFDNITTIINGLDLGEEYLKMLLTTEVGPLGVYSAVNEEEFDSWDDSNIALLRRIEKLEKRVSNLEG